jgi:hypothetical protein
MAYAILKKFQTEEPNWLVGDWLIGDWLIGEWSAVFELTI